MVLDTSQNINLLVSTLSTDLKTTFSSLRCNCRSNEITKAIILIQKSFKVRTRIIRYKKTDITFIFSQELGLSKSRNSLLKSICEHKMTGIMFICDADTKVELADSKLSLDNRCILLSDMEYDNGLKKTVKLNYFNYQNRFLKKIGACQLVSSQIALYLEKSEQIWSFPLFDESFGIGSKYGSSEENIFISDCIDSGIGITKLHNCITYKNFRSPARYIHGSKIFTKFPAFKRIFGNWLGPLVFLLFFIKKKVFNV